MATNTFAIKKISAREVLDSRGNPTVEATVELVGGAKAKAMVPSGASTGTYEALELRDGASRYGGKGVLKAVKNVNTTIARAFRHFDARKQRLLDQALIALDGTENKRKLGANAILAVSLATARAAAMQSKQPLYKYIRKTFRLKERGWRMPLPGLNVINGGRHADNGITVQEFMIVPRHRQFKERIRIGSEVFHALAKLLHAKRYTTAVGDEGGFAPAFSNNEQALKFIMKAITEAGYIPGKHVFLAMDAAASEFYRNGKYYFASKDTKTALSGKQLVATFERWLKKYPFVTLEDPLAEDDWEHWQLATKKLRKKVGIVGDDLFVTNVERIRKGIEMGVANSVLIKVNQIGTLSETMDAIQLARKHKYSIFMSHRSGETADTFIADLAVAVNAEFIKAGSMSRSERVEKYNRLMEIEGELKK